MAEPMLHVPQATLPVSRARRAFRTFTVALSVLGTVVFTAAFLITLLGRPWIESAASEYLREEVERQARKELGKVAERAGSTGAKAGLLAGVVDTRAHAFLERVRTERLDEKLSEIVRRALDALCDIDCEEKERAQNAADAKVLALGLLGGAVLEMKSAVQGLEAIVVGKYKELLYGLIDELRIFTGLNAGLFALTLLVLYLRRHAIDPVLVPALVMIVATSLSVVIYVTGTNWFWAVLTNSYFGYGYLVLVAIVLGFLVDIVLFQATITTAIFESFVRIAEAIGH